MVDVYNYIIRVVNILTFIYHGDMDTWVSFFRKEVTPPILLYLLLYALPVYEYSTKLKSQIYDLIQTNTPHPQDFKNCNSLFFVLVWY